jgi:hypothetical protein
MQYHTHNKPKPIVIVKLLLVKTFGMLFVGEIGGVWYIVCLMKMCVCHTCLLCVVLYVTMRCVCYWSV